MKSRFRRLRRWGWKQKEVGAAKFKVGDIVGEFKIKFYRGNTSVNQRNNHIMSKAQHWYTCQCSCGTKENRSQQELIDPRRTQACVNCRGLHVKSQHRKEKE